MTPAYTLVVTLHVLAAMVWLGGMFFLALVAPIVREVGDDALRARLFEKLGRRFRDVGWACILVLLVTGVLQLRSRGYWGMDVLGNPAFWATRLGFVLGAKLLLVTVMLAVQAVHDFRIGPAAGVAEPGTPEALRLRRTAALMARGSAMAGLVLIWFAVRLARGG